jgi:large subunit ribosomal protein L22
MPGPKTNEREGTRAVLRHARVSPYKVREVLNLVRGRPVHEAEDILRFSDRDAALIVGKVLHSAVSNAENNDELDPEELFVSACFADEGTTIKRWRPRARGRATRIRKRTSHITVIVSRLPDRELVRLQARRRSEQLAQRARRVAGARRSEGDTRSRAERRHGGAATEELEETTTDETVETSAEETTGSDETAVDEAAVDASGAEATDEVEEPEEVGEADSEEQASVDEPGPQGTGSDETTDSEVPVDQTAPAEDVPDAADEADAADEKDEK